MLVVEVVHEVCRGAARVHSGEVGSQVVRPSVEEGLVELFVKVEDLKVSQSNSIAKHGPAYTHHLQECRVVTFRSAGV